MNIDTASGSRQWSDTPEHFDQLARGVLKAARDAARELQPDPPDPNRVSWALGVLAGQTRAMLGTSMPDCPPVGIATQKEFVRTTLKLAIHVRAHSWARTDFTAIGAPDEDNEPHLGERQMSDAFDVLGRLMLPASAPEAWTATLVTECARGDKTLEAAVKLGKYLLHPTFLTLADDATRVLGEAVHRLNVNRMHELAHAVKAFPAGPASPRAKPAGQIRHAPRARRRKTLGDDKPDFVASADPYVPSLRSERADDEPDFVSGFAVPGDDDLRSIPASDEDVPEPWMRPRGFDRPF